MIIVNISEKHIALYWKNLEFLYLYVNWLICWADSHDDARFSILTQQNFGSNCFHASQKFVDQHRKIASLTLVSSPLAYGSRVVLCFSQFYCMFTSLFSLGNSFFFSSFISLSLPLAYRSHCDSFPLFCVYAMFILFFSFVSYSVCQFGFGVCTIVLCIFVHAYMQSLHSHSVDGMHNVVLLLGVHKTPYTLPHAHSPTILTRYGHVNVLYASSVDNERNRTRFFKPGACKYVRAGNVWTLLFSICSLCHSVGTRVANQ